MAFRPDGFPAHRLLGPGTRPAVWELGRIIACNRRRQATYTGYIRTQ